MMSTPEPHNVFSGFRSQRVALMATARVGWKVLDEAAVSKITLSP